MINGCVLHREGAKHLLVKHPLWTEFTARISIQWAIIVKYSFMHLECHKSHAKAGFASFQMLSLLNLLIPSAYKLDICKSIQCTSKKPCNKSLHYHNTNQISIEIKIVEKKKNKTMQWKTETRTTQEGIGKQRCKTNSPPLQ